MQNTLTITMVVIVTMYWFKNKNFPKFKIKIK